jgi:hypothetical protein
MAFVAYTIITKNVNPVRLAAEANAALWVRAAAVLVLVLVIEGSVDRREFRLPFQGGGLSAARRIGWASNRGRTLAGKKRDDSAAVGGDFCETQIRQRGQELEHHLSSLGSKLRRVVVMFQEGDNLLNSLWSQVDEGNEGADAGEEIVGVTCAVDGYAAQPRRIGAHRSGRDRRAFASGTSALAGQAHLRRRRCIAWRPPRYSEFPVAHAVI